MSSRARRRPAQARCLSETVGGFAKLVVLAELRKYITAGPAKLLRVALSILYQMIQPLA